MPKLSKLYAALSMMFLVACSSEIETAKSKAVDQCMQGSISTLGAYADKSKIKELCTCQSQGLISKWGEEKFLELSGKNLLNTQGDSALQQKILGDSRAVLMQCLKKMGAMQ